MSPHGYTNVNGTSIVVRAAMRGDREALDRLCRRLYVRLWTYARGHVSCAEDAEDVVATTFDRLLDALPRFDAERGEFQGWVFGILHNVLAEALRGGIGLQQMRIGRFRRLAPDSHFWSRLQHSTGRRRERMQDLALRLYRAIDKLEPLQRDVIRFRRLEGVTIAEVARRLRITETNVTTLDHRARKELRRLLVHAE